MPSKSKNFKLKYKRGLNFTEEKQVKAIVKKASLSSQERKYRDYNSSTTVDNGGIAYNMIAISRGDNTEERIGNDVTLTDLKLKVALSIADTTNVIRFLLVRFPEYISYGTSPDLTTVLQSTSAATPSVTDGAFLSPYKVDGAYKYQVLMDKTVLLDTSKLQRVFKFHKRFPKGLKLKYSGDNSIPVEGRIVLMAISDSGAATHPSIGWYSRATYVDA